MNRNLLLPTLCQGGKVISCVLAGGIIGAVFGPNLASAARDLLLPLGRLGAALLWLARHRRGTQNLRSTAGG